jgi:hypothetical protein
MWDAYTGGMLIMGIETKEEAERIIREELKDHVLAIVSWNSRGGIDAG